MLKHVPVSQLRIGMFIEKVGGPWHGHDLWRTKFRVGDAKQLAAVLGSGAQTCWINVEKGLDVALAAPASPAVAAPAGAAAPTSPRPLPAPLPVTMESELSRATRITASAKAVVETLFSDARLGRPLDVDAGREVVEQVVASVFRHSTALTSLLRIKEQDEYLHMHSVAVCALMVALAHERGMEEEACQRAGLAGLLHDVGKAAIPQELLDKPGKLTDAEFEIVKNHPVLGHAMLVNSGVDAPDALDVCLYHHEKMSGAGYPERLAGDALSVMVRMGAVCDVYDAVTSNRPYKEAWDPALALSRMASWEGHFDRSILAALIKTLGVYPVGSLVRLASSRLAIVTENRVGNLRTPQVRVFYSTKANEPVPVYLLDLSVPDARDHIVGLEPREQWNFPHLDHLWMPPAMS